MKYFYTYRVVLPDTGEFYLGSRETITSPQEDSYKGSMYSWKPDKSKLVKTILKTFPNRKSLLEEERKIILENIRNPLNRNYHIPSLAANFHKKTSLPFLIEQYGKEKGTEKYREINNKISKIHKGKPKSEEHKKKISDSERGKIISKEIKGKISDGLKRAYKEGRKIVPDYSGKKHPMYGKNHTEESKRKIGEASKGYKQREETKKKISESLKGKKLSEETKEKMRKPKSPETIENMRKAQRKRRSLK
jgi:hypothetical protein